MYQQEQKRWYSLGEAVSHHATIERVIELANLVQLLVIRDVRGPHERGVIGVPAGHV